MTDEAEASTIDTQPPQDNVEDGAVDDDGNDQEQQPAPPPEAESDDNVKEPEAEPSSPAIDTNNSGGVDLAVKKDDEKKDEMLKVGLDLLSFDDTEKEKDKNSVVGDSTTTPAATEDFVSPATNDEKEGSSEQSNGGENNAVSNPNGKSIKRSSSVNKPLVTASQFQPGDHVIRWEMLPIAWPIQIHGIVLESHEGIVVLVDFGLTAAVQEKSGGKSIKDRFKSFMNPKDVEKSLDGPDGVGSDKNGKQRLTVRVLSDPKELKQWSKVNYDGGLFGFGGKKTNEDGTPVDADGGDTTDHQDVEQVDEPKKGFFGFGKRKISRTPTPSQESTIGNTSEIDAVDGGSESTASQRGLFGMGMLSRKSSATATSSVDSGLNEDTTAPTTNGGDSTIISPTKTRQGIFGLGILPVNKQPIDNADTTTAPPPQGQQQPARQSWWKLGRLQDEQHQKDFTATTTTEPEMVPIDEDNGYLPPTTQSDAAGGKDDQAADPLAQPQPTPVDSSLDQHETADTTTPTSPTDELTKRHMNPAMAKLLAKKQESPDKKNNGNKPKADSSSDMAAAADAGTSGKKQPPALPKADPAKLVLARTRWLLHHGEAILPKYHCFHSNSECIAVFCKTGYWRNIQADVFLHSTAIGNAKTMGAATLGVAASVPLLAPVVGVAGLAMVGAPWLVLAKSKEKSEQITQQLTDAFWEQAEPEVFVECIEKWTKSPKAKPAIKNDETEESNDDKEKGVDVSPTADSNDTPTATPNVVNI